jgi:tripartite-type tricarboxylate transporter receptor subunit TctC
MRHPYLALCVISALTLIAEVREAVCTEAWPAQTVKIVTPFPAGSGGDVTARPFAERLAGLWGKPVIVENRPGGDGIVAVMAVLNSTDGHTILYTNGGPLTSNQLSHAGKLPYDPVHDLLPISVGAEVLVALGVPASLPVNNVAEFLKLASSRPGELNWSGTQGSLDYLIPGFFRHARVDLTRVPYRDVASAMQDLSQSRLQLYVAAVATQLPMKQAGLVRILAITNRERSPGLPDVPTAEEAGYPDLRFEAFLGFFAPRSMPGDLRERISTDLRAVSRDDGLGRKFEDMGMKLRVTTPSELAQMIADERAALARLSGTPASQQKDR